MTDDNKHNAQAVEPIGETDTCATCTGDACAKGCCSARCNLDSYNWLQDIPGGKNDFDIVEVHFKNTRRGFYRNSAKLDLKQGDVVAVEANPGHDIGTVALTGNLVKLQMKRTRLRRDAEILRVFRKAKPADIERFEQAKARETDTMIRSRQIAKDLGLNMKIGDVEYQGDGNKAIFYYIADGRVDFRQLIKVLADVFKIRVEMKQIGARQEAGRIGGIGPCGRALCCASWMSTFVSVATGAARYQDISLNPQKLAGQCAKLKCCINFEVDTYAEAAKSLPRRDVVLETQDKTYYHFKTDILKREITYSSQKGAPVDLVTLTPERVAQVAAMNKNGEKPEELQEDGRRKPVEVSAFGDLVGQDSISRFDTAKKKKKKKNRNKPQSNKEQKNDSKQPKNDGKQRKGDGDGKREGDNRNRRNRQRGKGEEQRPNKGQEQRPAKPQEPARPVSKRDFRPSKPVQGNGDRRNRQRNNKGE